MPRRAINKPEVVERILSALRVGNTRSAAALYGGIEPETLYRWIARDSQFKHIVEKAEADGEVRHVARIAKAADEGTWQASAWWLERRRPEDFARREFRTLEGGDPAKPLKITHVQVLHVDEKPD